MSEISENKINENRIPQRKNFVLQSSRLNQVSSSIPIGKTNSMLRPSMLNNSLPAADAAITTEEDENDVGNSTTGYQLSRSPSSTNLFKPTENPFVLNTTTALNDEDDDEPSSTTKSNSENVTDLCNTSNSDDKNEEETKIDPLSLLSNNRKTNLFTIKTATENCSFVFGQNVHERVTGENVQQCNSSSNATSETVNNSELLFSAATTNKDLQNSTENSHQHDQPPKETSIESLTEVARAYEESRVQKRKYEEVETVTGEENEINVLDVNSKLFAFVSSNWEERGPGSLRLNDPKDKLKSSRLVFRTSGNYRVLVNTKIWSGMVVENPSKKSIRLTAIDSAGQIKVFLIMARPDDITNLKIALQQRVELEKSKDMDGTNSELKEPPTKKILHS